MLPTGTGWESVLALGTTRAEKAAWDYEGRESWVRLDRVLDVPEESIRREGAILEREVFDVVAARLRADYAWR